MSLWRCMVVMGSSMNGYSSNGDDWKYVFVCTVMEELLQW